MRYLPLSLLLLLFAASVNAQSIAISNDGSSPDPKAMLEVKSTTKGLLLPRMTEVQKNQLKDLAPSGVPVGLIVFQTDGDRGFYYNASSIPSIPTWKKMTTGDELFWDYASPGYIYNSGSSNFGIGTATPAAKLHISNTSLEKLRLENSMALASGVANSIVLKTGAYFTHALRSIGTSATEARLGIFTGANGDTAQLREKLTISNYGNVGINNSSPIYQLDVNGWVRLSGAGLSPKIFFNKSDNAVGPSFGLVNDTTLGFFGPTNIGNWRVGVDVKNGQVGIGTSDPNKGKLVVVGTVGAVSALFGETTAGVAIENGNPGVAFNSYFNGTRKSLASGYGSLIGQDPATGNLYMLSSAASSLAGGNLSLSYRMLIDKDGNIGVQGNTDPHAPLSFANATGPKISLWGTNPASNYGIGIQGALLQLYSDGAGSDIAFGHGGSAAANFTETMRIKGNGNVGIGTVSPTEKLEIFRGRLRFRGNMAGNYAHGITWTNNTGTTERSFVGQYDDNSLGFFGFAGAGWGFLWDVNDGSVRIGTLQKSPGYLLNIGGKAIAEEVRVQLRANWPDYVFHRNYQLMPLHQLEAYIHKNHHLPNIPKAETLEKEGTDLGEMQRKMMEKIEELTLYVIDLKKELRKQEAEIKKLKQKK